MAALDDRERVSVDKGSSLQREMQGGGRRNGKDVIGGFDMPI
jgi:hypothetical protein